MTDDKGLDDRIAFYKEHYKNHLLPAIRAEAERRILAGRIMVECVAFLRSGGTHCFGQMVEHMSALPRSIRIAIPPTNKRTKDEAWIYLEKASHESKTAVYRERGAR